MSAQGSSVWPAVAKEVHEQHTIPPPSWLPLDSDDEKPAPAPVAAEQRIPAYADSVHSLYRQLNTYQTKLKPEDQQRLATAQAKARTELSKGARKKGCCL
ncbi:hypothetical protein AB1Y20_015807 [Prymnesium parvum]|uniref:Uncharacterized protein n=1 Tax=Prymnesium parvum TaxID=97485 RepID=A0AB34K2I6_PRYPA